ncbi:hypothetical protein NKI64_26990 [Mesorhizobium sp. M0478]|jgi:hypothetical protein
MIARPAAGDSPNPTDDMVATTALSTLARRSMIGRPSGVHSMKPAHDRMTRA